MGRVKRLSSVTPKPNGPPLDVWLQRAAHLTQVLLLGLGVFGYFYTVRPIHQKEILDEEIAQKRIELREKEKEMRVLAEGIKQKANELDEKERALSLAKSEVYSAKSEAHSAKSEARESYSELRIHLLGQFTNRVQDCARPALTQKLDLAILKACPKLMEETAGYLLEKLKANDRRVILGEVGKALNGIQPQLEALLQKRQKFEEADLQEAANIQAQIEAIPSTPDGERPLRSSLDRYQLQLRLSSVQSRERSRRVETYSELAKILSEAGSVAWDKAYDKFKS